MLDVDGDVGIDAGGDAFGDDVGDVVWMLIDVEMLVKMELLV